MLYMRVNDLTAPDAHQEKSQGESVDRMYRKFDRLLLDRTYKQYTTTTTKMDRTYNNNNKTIFLDVTHGTISIAVSIVHYIISNAYGECYTFTKKK